MKITDWIIGWEKLVPTDFQEEWDNCGLQLGRTDRDLTGIVVSLDLTDQVLEEAIDRSANLIVCHHPLLFKPVRRIAESDPTGRLILRAIESGITVYAAHTNLDAVRGGVNQVLAEKCGLSSIRPLHSPLPGQPMDDLYQGIGLVGYIEASGLGAYADRLKQALDLDHVLVYGDPDRKLEKVAVVGGAGMDFVQAALEKNCDLLITGDIKYHEAMEALDRGLSLIDPGHYASEQPVLDRISSWSEEFAPGMVKAVFRNTPAHRRVF